MKMLDGMTPTVFLAWIARRDMNAKVAALTHCECRETPTQCPKCNAIPLSHVMAWRSVYEPKKD